VLHDPAKRIDKVNTISKIRRMDIRFEFNGTTFVWSAKKAETNPGKHDGITFEQAAAVFFDPLFRLVDAGRHVEARDAVIGYDASGSLLFVVHVLIESECIRIISARRATHQERRDHEHS
jgi:uncharacterized DUF497 family protein